MEQVSMFDYQRGQHTDRVYARNDAPETSRAAARSWIGKTGRDRLRILSELSIVADGLTDQQLQDRLHIRESSERPRRVSLVADRFVADSGRTRPTESNRQATIWIITSAGLQALRERGAA